MITHIVNQKSDGSGKFRTSQGWTVLKSTDYMERFVNEKLEDGPVEVRATPDHLTITGVVVEHGVVEVPPEFAGAVTCTICDRSWDDFQSTERTPAPAGRCPFEEDHPEEDETNEFVLVAPVRDGGTVVLFEAEDGSVIAVDHHYAQDIINAFGDDTGVPVVVEDWQIVRRAS